MGRGRSVGGGKICPPKDWRWAPKPNARARCIGSHLIGKKGGGQEGVRKRFVEASAACRKSGK